jgi:hypothetical protein
METQDAEGRRLNDWSKMRRVDSSGEVFPTYEGKSQSIVNGRTSYAALLESNPVGLGEIRRGGAVQPA